MRGPCSCSILGCTAGFVQSQQDEPPGSASPLVAATLQRLSSAANSCRNLAESAQADTDLLHVLFSPSLVLSVVWVLHWNSPFTTSLPSTHPHVSSVKGYWDRFYFESEHRTQVCPWALSNLLSKQLWLLSYIFLSCVSCPCSEPGTENTPWKLCSGWCCDWNRETTTTPSSVILLLPKVLHSCFNNAAQPVLVGTEGFVVFQLSQSSLKWVAVIMIYCVPHSLYKQCEFPLENEGNFGHYFCLLYCIKIIIFPAFSTVEIIFLMICYILIKRSYLKTEVYFYVYRICFWSAFVH